MLDSIRLKARMESITNTFVCLVLLGAAAAIWFGLIGGYFTARFGTPTAINLATFQALPEKPIYFASVTGETYDTGYWWRHVVFRRTDDLDHFGLLDLGGQYLMLYTPYPVDTARTNWVGTVYPMPSDIRSEILTPLQTEQWPEINGLVVPYFLNVVEAEEGFLYWFGLFVCGLMTAVAVYFLVAVAIVTINPKRHDIYKDLARFGAPLDKVAEKIQADFQQGVIKIGAWEFGKVFIVRRSTVAFQVLLYRDLLYAYWDQLRDNKGRVTNETFYFLDRYGKQIKWQTNEKDAAAIQKLLMQRAPWAHIGADSEVMRMWKRDRKRLTEQVDSQRQRLRDDRAARRTEPQETPTPIQWG